MAKKAQEWLETKYNNKSVSGKIRLYNNGTDSEELTGELAVENYVNIEEINLERWKKDGISTLKGKITKLTINNCPKVKRIFFSNNEVSEIIFKGSFSNLERLEVADNKLTEIDISKLTNLEGLNIARNPLSPQGVKGIENSTKLKIINLFGTPGLNLKAYLKNYQGGDWNTTCNNVWIKYIIPAQENAIVKKVDDNDLKTELAKTGKNFSTSVEVWFKSSNTVEQLIERAGEIFQALTNIRQEWLTKVIKDVLGLKLTDSLPSDWQSKLAKKEDLNKWTTKFTNTPENIKKHMEEQATLIKELSHELSRIGKLKPELKTRVEVSQQFKY